MRLPDGRTIAVTLVENDRGKARLGFEAPPDVQILREELLAPGERDKRK